MDPVIRTALIPVEADVLDEDGESIGGIIVFVDGRYLSSVEIFDWTDGPPINPLPPLRQLELTVNHETAKQCGPVKVSHDPSRG